MKQIGLTLAAVAALGIGAQASLAGDGHSYGQSRPGGDRFHANLEHRAFHRELEHREAHRHPMTGPQHARLHDQLDHQAFHDQLRDRAYHRAYDYRPYRVSPYYRGWSYSYPSHSRVMGITTANGHRFLFGF